MTDRTPRVDLIPWDYDSDKHVERMYQQRLACGWRSDEVREKWVGLGRAGRKTLYWVWTEREEGGGGGHCTARGWDDDFDNVRADGPQRLGHGARIKVLRDDLPGRDEILSKHLAANPDEASPIRDTAPACFHQPRPPTRRAFAPVGHVALDLRPEQNAELGLLRPPLSSSTTPDGGDGDGDGDRVNDKERIVWVAGLYISHALQAGGIGGETMRLAEAIAAREPLWAGWIVLDTMSREQHRTSNFMRSVYAARGQSPPALSTQDWYERQGYRVFATETSRYEWADPATGEPKSISIDCVFMRKRLLVR